jgi:hypothetical protein
MVIKHLAASAVAAAATLIAAPAFSQDMRAPMTTFFVSIPLDARTPKEQTPNFGLQFQGMKPYQAVQVDYQSFKFLPAVIAAMEVKYVVAGAVAIGAAAAVAHKDKKTSASFAQQQAEQKAACPEVC